MVIGKQTSWSSAASLTDQGTLATYLCQLTSSVSHSALEASGLAQCDSVLL